MKPGGTRDVGEHIAKGQLFGGAPAIAGKD